MSSHHVSRYIPYYIVIPRPGNHHMPPSSGDHARPSRLGVNIVARLSGDMPGYLGTVESYAARLRGDMPGQLGTVGSYRHIVNITYHYYTTHRYIIPAGRPAHQDRKSVV